MPTISELDAVYIILNGEAAWKADTQLETAASTDIWRDQVDNANV